MAKFLVKHDKLSSLVGCHNGTRYNVPPEGLLLEDTFDKDGNLVTKVEDVVKSISDDYNNVAVNKAVFTVTELEEDVED